jgi:mannose-1-phosphate guanylyltransferase
MLQPGRPLPPKPSPRRWSIVLAGGDGTRLHDYVQRRFGEVRPKQYCAFHGGRTLLQHTVARAHRLAPPLRTVTVIAEHHGRWAHGQLAADGGTLVVQPANRDTAAGVYLPLAWVRARDPEAVVHVLPSDHYVDSEARCVAAIAKAAALAAARPGRIVLLGAEPDAADTDYGYILPHGGFARGVTGIASFVEKPPRPVAEAAVRHGALWNTMIMVGTVSAFWDAGSECVPEVMAHLERLVAAVDTPAEVAVLREVYATMPVANFSHHVLARSPARCLVARLEGVAWSDWGRAERIEATLAGLPGAASAPAPGAATMSATT